MTNDNNNTLLTIFILFPIVCLFLAVVIIVGKIISQTDNTIKGRTQGIVFCSEKPKECSLEYQYLKLKETQK